MPGILVCFAYFLILPPLLERLFFRKIVAQGSPQELKQQTNSESLEQAFLALTGSSIREESASEADQFRQMARMWRK